MLKIRIAEMHDAEQMLAIYSPFIINSGTTQETEIPSVNDFSKRIISTLEERPWLAAESDGGIAGYAYAGRHRERKGYQWCTEASVYIHEKFIRNGIARVLYSALFDLLKLQGYVNVYAVITLPNDKSVAFHEDFGFRYLTTYKKIGYKLGKWHDVGWWEINVNPHTDKQADPISFPMLDAAEVKAILEKASRSLYK